MLSVGEVSMRGMGPAESHDTDRMWVCARLCLRGKKNYSCLLPSAVFSGQGGHFEGERQETCVDQTGQKQ